MMLPGTRPEYLPELWRRALAHAGFAPVAFEDAPPDGYRFLRESGTTVVLRRAWLDARLLEMLGPVSK